MHKKFTYDWTQFVQRIEIAADREKVFKAWTDAREVEKWFSVKAEIEPQKGGRVMYEWLGGDTMDAEIIAIRKPSRFVIPFGPDGMQVEVKILKIKGGSRVELVQTGMKTSPKAKVEMHMGCQKGWAFFLTNLKAYLEHGIDLRSHDPAKSYNQKFVNS